MRVINKASVVFLVLDDYTKEPLTGVTIKCNGELIPYVKKNDGYNVFINMSPGKYRFELFKRGFISMAYEAEVTEVQPVQFVVPMKYSMDNLSANALSKIVFTIKKDGAALTDCNVKIRLNTKVPCLRLIEPIPKGKNTAVINSDYNKRFLYQEYNYDKKSTVDVFFTGYDPEKQVYLTKEFYKSKVPEGGLLRPVWRFITSGRGEFILPINRMFISDGETEFAVSVGDKTVTKKIDVNGNNHVTVEV